MEFFAPKTALEALTLKAEHENSAFLGGGTELNRLGAFTHPERLISLAGLGWNKIERKGETLRLGSLVTFTQALGSDLVPEGLKEALRFMASFPKRNMATLAGNVARHGDESYLVPTLLAYGARLVTVTLKDGKASQKKVSLESYLENEMDGLLIKAIELDPKKVVRSKRFALTQESHSSVTVAYGAPSVLAAAVHGSGIQLLPHAMAALEGGDVDRARFHELVVQDVQAVDDFTGSAAYKRYLVEEGLWELAREAKA